MKKKTSAPRRRRSWKPPPKPRVEKTPPRRRRLPRRMPTGRSWRSIPFSPCWTKEDKLLRLAAEFDNFRRRSQKEKDGVWADATAKAVNALLPVYDNLERALKQETADEAYKKGVEMTMAGLMKALEGLGVTQINAAGRPFDPNVHNAVMHIEDESFGENTVAEVFQAGFMLGEKVIRFAMVKVAN